MKYSIFIKFFRYSDFLQKETNAYDECCLYSKVKTIIPYKTYIKVTGCLSVFVCLYRRMVFFLLCSFSLVPGRFVTIFGEGTTTLQREITTRKITNPSKKYLFTFSFKNWKWRWGDLTIWYKNNSLLLCSIKLSGPYYVCLCVNLYSIISRNCFLVE